MFQILFCFAVLMTNALSCDKELDSISPTHCTGFSKDSKILNFYISSGDRFDICSNKMGYNLVLMNYSIFDANYARKYFVSDDVPLRIYVNCFLKSNSCCYYELKDKKSSKYLNNLL
jgi:hypothetical protein